MSKVRFSPALLSAALVVALLFSILPPAHAAVGDFIYRIGVDYHFDRPSGAVTDAAGRAYLVDSQDNDIYVFDANGNLERRIPVSLDYHQGILDIDIDAAGNFYVLTTNAPDGKIKVLDNSGALLREFGDQHPGFPPAPDGSFVFASAIAADPNTGYVYVADGITRDVQVFDHNGDFVRSWGGYSRYEPSGLHVDTSGNLYVASSYAVEVYDSAGGSLPSISPGGNPYDLDINSATGEIHIAVGGIPSSVKVYDSSGTYIRSYAEGANLHRDYNGIAVDVNGTTYVTDYRYNTDAGFKVFDASGSYERVVGAWGIQEGKFNKPNHLAVDGAGRIYVADTDNHRVQVFDADGTFLRSWGTYGTGPGEFSYPTGIAVKGSGNVYVSERRKIHVFTQDGDFLRSWERTGTLGDNDLNVVFAIEVDEAGNVYVADAGSHRIIVFDPYGNPQYGWRIWDHGPYDVAVDAEGLIYVLSSEGGFADIYVYESPGTFVKGWQSLAYYAYTFALDSCENIHIVGRNGNVRIFDQERTLLADWGSGGYELGNFIEPWGIAAPGNGRVYVSEIGNHRVQVFEGIDSCGGGTVTADAGPDQTVEQTSPAGAEVVLDGSGSEGYCGDALTYDWNWAGGTATGVNPVVLLPAGYTEITLTASCGTDQAQDSLSVTVEDTQPPVTVAVITGVLGTNNWFVSDVSIALSSLDSGSGVSDIRYTMNAGTEVVVPGGAATIDLLDDGLYDLSYYATDLAGNVEAAQALSVNIDSTPPEVIITGVEDGASYIVGSEPAPDYTATDSLSGLASAEAVLSGGCGNGLGAFTYTVTALDNAGNTAVASATYQVTYYFGDFLGKLGDRKPFKLGSTVPVKFQLLDAFGNYISTAVATISLQMYSDDEPVGDPVEATSTSGADTGNIFRYVPADNQYIYKLSTDQFSVGTWMLTVSLDDGTEKSVLIGFK